MITSHAGETKIKRLIWDIETSPNVVLSWRVGYKINLTPDNILKERQIICIGYKWQGQKTTHVLRWDDKHDDRKMLKEFLAVAHEADEMIAHFGDSFDMPWFRARCLIQGLDPTPAFKTVDTKAWASKYFYFNSNKLDYLGGVLGFGHKIDTDYDLWKDIVLHSSKSALDKMCRYCMRDVELLERVYEKLQTCVAPKTHVGVLNGHGRWTCPLTGSSNVRRKKVVVTPKGIVQHQMVCEESGHYYKISDFVYQQFLKSRNENKTKAAPCCKAATRAASRRSKTKA